MGWADALTWAEVPVAADGGEDHVASKSTLRAYVGWELRPDSATPVSVVLRNTDGSPVTPAQWRKVKTSEIIAAGRLWLVFAGHYAPTLAVITGQPLTADEQAAADELAELVPDESRPQTRVYPPEHYQRVARLYNAEVAAANPQPVQTILRELHKTMPSLKETTLRGWIRTAKQRGYITTLARKR